MRQSWETMTSVSAGHIIQTPTQPVGSGRPQRESNPGPPHQESRALPQSYRAPRVCVCVWGGGGKYYRPEKEVRVYRMLPPLPLIFIVFDCRGHNDFPRSLCL